MTQECDVLTTKTNQSISDEFENELSSLRNESKYVKNSKVEISNRNFESIQMGDVSCMLFIKFSNKGLLKSPRLIAEKIWKNAMVGVKPFRYCQRILPIDYTCSTNVNDIKNGMEKIFLSYPDIFSSPLESNSMDSSIPLSYKMTSFSILYESRHNSNLDKTVIIELLSSMVMSKKCSLFQPPCPFFVDLEKPKVTILVQVIKVSV